MTASDLLEVIRKGRTALEKTLFSKTAQELAKPIAKRVAEIGKAAIRLTWRNELKYEFAAYYEGIPMAVYVAAEEKAKAATEQYFAAMRAYTYACKEVDFLNALRAAIMRDFDPNLGMRHTTDKRFQQNSALRIELDLTDPKRAGDLDVEVLLGGVEAKRTDPTTLAFDIESETLNRAIDDGSGNLELMLDVTR